MITFTRVVLLFAVSVLLLACSGGGEADRAHNYRETVDRDAGSRDPVDQEVAEVVGRSSGSAVPQQKGGSPSGFAAKVKFKGREVLAIKPMSDGAKLVNAAGLELGRYKVRDGFRVKVKDGSDRELGQIRGDAAKIHIENASGERTFALQRQDDGDYKLETASGELLYKIKTRDYGLKIEDANEAEVAKVKVSAGKTSLRNAQDETILSTKDSISVLAMACLALEKLDQPMRVGLAVRIQAEGK